MDFPYVASFGDGSMLAISLPASWVKAGRSGEALLLPPAVRALDRLRALFTDHMKFTPGFIVSLREAMELTQADFGRKLGVSKMTVSRWECGRMGRRASAIAAMRALQERSRREGVRIDGEKRVKTSSSPVRRGRRRVPERRHALR